MARHLRPREFLLGVEGIALMRHLFEDDALAVTRLEEIRRIACGDEGVYQLGGDVLVIRQCLKPRFGPAEAAMQGPASQFIPDATAAAYVGLPGALIWELEYGHCCGASRLGTAGTSLQMALRR